MSSSCPHCHQSIEEDFGLVTCPRCQFIFLVGETEVGSAEVEPAGIQDFSHSEGSSDSLSVSISTTYATPSAASSVDDPSHFGGDSSISGDPSVSVVGELEGSGDPSGAGAPSTEGIFQSLVDFGNELVVGEGSPQSQDLSYTVSIRGIDHQDLRALVLETLSQKNLGWDGEALMETVKDGVLTLNGLTSIQAHLVVRSLKKFHIPSSWTQHLMIGVGFWVILFLSLVGCHWAWASGGGEGEEGGGSASHASSASASGSTSSSSGGSTSGGSTKGEKRALPEWIEIQSRLSSLAGKIQVTEGNIERLLEQKMVLRDNSSEVKKVVEDLIFMHRELKRLVEEYERANAQLKFRYPDRDIKVSERVYKRFDVKSLEEMESYVTIQSRLKRNLEKMRHQYPSSSQPRVLSKGPLGEEESGTRMPAGMERPNIPNVLDERPRIIRSGP